MNMLDLFLIIILAAVFALALILWIRGRRKGNGCFGCNGDCASCSGHLRVPQEKTMEQH
jgi:hypothetical protein